MEEEQPGILPDVYPSDNIEAMLKAGETMESALYLQRYAVYTEFKELGHITVLVEYCKQTIPELLRKKNFDEEGPRLKDIAVQTGATEKHVFWFHREMAKRLAARQHAFIAYTASNQFNFYDLAEDVTKIRLITVAECGTCKRLHAPELPLEECKFCHCAAYCNNRCRKKDLKFHQKHCKSLRQDYERRKNRLEVLKRQQVERQMTTDDILNVGIAKQQQPATASQPAQQDTREEERVEDMDDDVDVAPVVVVQPQQQQQQKIAHDPDYARQLVERLQGALSKEDEPDVSAILLVLIEQACSTGEFERLAATSRLQNLKTHWITVQETMVQRSNCDYLLVLCDSALQAPEFFTLDKECTLLAQCACGDGDHHFGVYACVDEMKHATTTTTTVVPVPDARVDEMNRRGSPSLSASSSSSDSEGWVDTTPPRKGGVWKWRGAGCSVVIDCVYPDGYVEFHVKDSQDPDDWDKRRKRADFLSEFSHQYTM